MIEFIHTNYNGTEANFLAKQEIIFHNHYRKDLDKEDFVTPILIIGDRPFDCLELKLYTNEAICLAEIEYSKEKNALVVTPSYIKSKSFLKLEFQYHAESEVHFESKIFLKDGESFTEKLDWRYREGEQYASFSMAYSNAFIFLSVLAIIPTAILYIATILSFRIVYPISDKLFFNPLSLTFYVLILGYLIMKIRVWEKESLLPFKIKDWFEVRKS